MIQNKVTLVCTSLNPDEKLLNKMLDSAKGFHEIILHIDKETINRINDKGECIERIHLPVHRTIPEAYNLMIDKFVQTDWVCCFCDDDYFYPDELSKMINAVSEGIIAGVAHYNFHISGYMPPQDYRGRINKLFTGKTEYNLGEKKLITAKLLKKHNRLPAGSFFRKCAWDMAGGFQGNKCHDWDLWKRMAQVGIEFEYFDYVVYNMVRRPTGAWIKQNA